MTSRLDDDDVTVGNDVAVAESRESKIQQRQSWSDWIVQPGMLKKLTQIEDEMDECLMSVDANDDVADTAYNLRRTYSVNVRGTSTSGLDGDAGCRATVATSKSDQTLSWRCSWKQTRSVCDGTAKGAATSGIQLTDDDAADGSVFVDAPPITAAAAVVITPPELSPRQTDGTVSTDGLGSSGNYVSGLGRSRSDVTQRRFHRRRSAARCPVDLAAVSGLYLYAAHLPAPRHGHSCSAIGDSVLCDAAAATDSSNDSAQPEVKEQQPGLDALTRQQRMSVK